MNYKVASTLNDVLDAWCLVYKQYLAASLIAPNEFSVFTFPEHLSNNTAVITGNKMGHTVCTVSGVLDSERGLPLDSYYKRELDQLRSEGKHIIEIGLLADARGRNNFSNILELMSGVARFGVYSNHHDYVVGVHPRRVNFFRQTFGFKPAGEVRGYESLNTAPVILLHANGKAMETLSREATQKIYNEPLDFDFGSRYQFNPENFISRPEFASSIERFIGTIWNRTSSLQEA